MRVVTRLFALVTAGVLIAGVAQAQKHEMGVDATLMYSKPSGQDGAIFLGAPVDVRIGFGSAGLSWETRFGLTYVKPKDGYAFSFTPDVNALWKLNGATANKGMYATGGIGLDMLRETDGTKSTRVGLNGGLGTRHPMGDVALRTELFVRYFLKKGNVGDADYGPAVTSFGVRFGISFWHGH